MEFQGFLWNSYGIPMNSYGILKEFQGFLWNSYGIHRIPIEFPRNSKEFQGIPKEFILRNSYGIAKEFINSGNCVKTRQYINSGNCVKTKHCYQQWELSKNETLLSVLNCVKTIRTQPHDSLA